MRNKSIQRPTPVTVVCLLGFLGVLLPLPIALMQMGGQENPFGLAAFPAWYAPLSLLLGTMSVAGLVEIWRMRRTGVYLYTGVFAVSLLLMTATHLLQLGALVLPLLIIAVGFTQLGNMVEGI